MQRRKPRRSASLPAHRDEHPASAKDMVPSGAQIEKISATVRATIASLRSLMFTLRPSSLDRGGLAMALETYIDQQESVHDSTRYELENRPRWLSVPVAGIVRMLEEEP